MRILLVTDSPFIPSGLSRVGRELAMGLKNSGHDIGYLGWWHRNDIPTTPQPFPYWFTNNGLYGADVLDGVVQKFQPDVVLTIGDMWNVAYISDTNQCRTRRYFQWCAYISVDGEPVNGGLPPSVIPVIQDVDIPVAYTYYAKNAILKSVHDQELFNRLQVIYHGVDHNLFHPLAREERRKARQEYRLDDKFMFLTVCRNQSRKNIPDIFQAWKIFSELDETKGKVILWPHMYFNDPMGWRIADLLEVLRLKNQSIMYFNQVAYAPSEFHLVSDQDLAKLYQIADAFMLISGEGFGLPTFEAMATRLPCILLDHSASGELGANGRAELVGVKDTSTWTGMHLTQRPLGDVNGLVEAMLRIYRNRKHREELAQKGYDFVQQYSWQKIISQWNHLFLSYEIPFLAPKTMEVVA